MFKRLTLTALLGWSSGCSYLLISPAPEIGSRPAYPIACTSNQSAPLFDALGAAFFAASTVGVLAGVSVPLESGAIVSAIVATALLGSSVSGFSASARCNRVQAQSQACVGGSEASCRALTWDPRTARRAPATSSPIPMANPGDACTTGDDCGVGYCIDGACR